MNIEMDEQYDREKGKGGIENEASCIPLRESKPRIKGKETVELNGRSEANT